MTQSKIQPYLFFGGRCEEALEFYRAVLGAEIEAVMRFSESPDPIPPGMLPPGHENKVMHAAFRLGETQLLASDGMSGEANFGGFSLAWSVENEAEVDRVFGALSEGGTVQMPVGPTFWSPRFGALTDKFGLDWMIMVAAEPAS